ncbi:MAG: hypothetical protein IKD69_00820, partial [Solobacterium sp.]|nr:hypothetical protein [Solobacterium sp.]
RFVILLSDEPMPESQRPLGEALVKQGYTLRRVDTIAGLVEKISIFEDGVSDILAELGKYDSFIEYLDNHQGKAESVTSIEYQKTENDVMKINIRFDDRGMSFHIPVAMLEEELKPQEGLYHIDEASFPVVDSDTIIGMFLKEGA